MKPVKVYSTRTCPYCIRATWLLEKRGIPYEETDVSGQPDMRAWLVRVTGRRTVPQIFIGDLSIGGCDELFALDRSGQLDLLLDDGAGQEAASRLG